MKLLSPSDPHRGMIDMPLLVCRHCKKALHYVKRSDLPFFPFCSEKCKLLDLGDWFDERHRISGEPSPEEPGDRR